LTVILPLCADTLTGSRNASRLLDGGRPFGTVSIDQFPDVDGYVFVAGGAGIVPRTASGSTWSEGRCRLARAASETPC
jgi:hypothetical protein